MKLAVTRLHTQGPSAAQVAYLPVHDASDDYRGKDHLQEELGMPS